MDRSYIANRLAELEKWIAQNEGFIARQQAIIDRLEANSMDTAMARKQMATFVRTGESLARHRGRLLETLRTLP